MLLGRAVASCPAYDVTMGQLLGQTDPNGYTLVTCMTLQAQMTQVFTHLTSHPSRLYNAAWVEWESVRNLAQVIS